MADIFTLMGRIKLEGADAANAQLGTFDQKAQGIGGRLKALTPILLGFGAAIVGMGIGAVKMAADFDKGMRETNSMLLLGQKEFKQLSDDVLKMSRSIGVDAVDSTKALYQAISAGVPKENVVEFLAIASKAAIAGVTDTTTAVDGLTTVINAFKLPVSEAGHVADVMFAAVKAGKTTFGELSSAMFNVAPLASSAGIAFEEVTAAVAALTTAGVPTSVATTQIRAAIQGILKPSEEMVGIFKAAGFASGQLALEQLGLQGAMQILKDATHGDIGALTTLVGSIEGVGAVLSLTGAQSGAFASTLKDMKENSGQAGDAFAEMEKTASRAWERLTNNAKGMAIEIGSKVLPAFVSALDTVGVAFNGLVAVGQGVYQFFKDNIWIVEAAGATLAAYAIMQIPKLVMALPGMIAQIVASTVAFYAQAVAAGAAAIATAAAALPFIAIGAAIAAAIFIGIQIVKNWDDIARAAGQLWDAVTAAWKEIEAIFDWEKIKASFLAVGGAIIGGIWEGIKAAMGGLTDFLFGWLKTDLPEGAMAAMGAASPAKLFMPVGRAITEGIAVGIKRGASVAKIALEDALSELQRMADAAAMARQSVLAGAATEAEQAWQMVAGRVSGGMSWADAVAAVRRDQPGLGKGLDIITTGEGMPMSPFTPGGQAGGRIRVPGFEYGGMVKGLSGSAQLAVLHPPEVIIPGAQFDAMIGLLEVIASKPGIDGPGFADAVSNRQASRSFSLSRMGAG